MSSGHFNKGPAYGLSAEIKNKLAQKYDAQKEEELRLWIEDVTGRKIVGGFMEGLKDGVVLCELINKLQPGSVRKINQSTQNWHQLENVGNFIKAITEYGLRPNDIFEANDLFENFNHTQVQSTLITLAGVMGTNKFASQKGMTSYGTRRHLYDPKSGSEKPMDQKIDSKLQYGSGSPILTQFMCAGMTAPGTKRQIYEQKLGMEKCDSMNVSLQMGTNKMASQQGMTVYGLGRQVYDPKYCGSGEQLNLSEDYNSHNSQDYCD
ncbi:UNVERIFIED_CONTAM: hypothetical protein FKN15_041933 [Acipenser sinensis]